MTSELRKADKSLGLKQLQATLNYQFSDISLLEQALTHKSFAKNHNERMEFLGDSILGSSITIFLYKHFSELNEGVLSRVRASLVKGETLAEIAKEIKLGGKLLLGAGELKSGGHQRASILADAVEAIIGAVYLESGFERASELVLGLFEQRLEKDAIYALDKDPKSRLQELLQARQLELPEYEIVKTEGKDHNQVFTLVCRVKSLNIEVEVQAKSRRNAERKAAELIVAQIK